MPTLFRRLVLGIAVALGAVGTASAQPNYNWFQPATGTTANWTTSTWRVGPPTGTGTNTTTITLNTFGNNTNAFTFTNDVNPYLVNGFTFNTFGAAFTQDLGANALTLGGTNPFVAQNGSAAATISGAGGVTLAAAATLGGSGNGDLIVASAVGGTGALTVDRSSPFGAANLTGTNTFLGNVTIQNGVLQIPADAGLGTATNGLTFGTGASASRAILTAGGTYGTTRTLATGGGGIFATTGDTNWAGAVTGSGTLTKVGTGSTLGLNGDLSGFTGAIQLGGTSRVVGGTTFNRPYINPGTIEGLLLLGNGTPGTGSLAAGVPSVTAGYNTSIAIDNTSNTEAGRIKSATALNLNNGRFLYRSGGGAALNESLGALTVTGNGVLVSGANDGPAAGTVITFASLTRVDRASLTLIGSTDTSLNGQVGGTPGALTVNFKVAGGVTVPAGTGTAIGVVPWAHMVNNATFGNAGYATHLVTYDANGFRPLAAGEFATATTSAEFLAAAGSNVNLDVASVTIAAPVSVKSMFIVDGAGNNTTFTGGSTLTVENGAISHFNQITFNGPTLNFGGQTGYINLGDQFFVQGTSSITGTQGVVFNSAATGFNTVNLSNTTASTFTGGLYVNGNVILSYTAENQLGALTEPITLAGGVLRYNGAGAGTLSSGRNLNVNAATGILRMNTANTLTVNSLLAGTGQLTVDAALAGSTVIFGNGASTHTGGIQVGGTNAQTVAYAANPTGGGSGAFGAGPLLVTNTATPTIRVDVANATIGNAVTLAAAANLNTQSNATTLSGVLAGTGGLTKAGTGTLTLTAASPNYSGPLVVGAGGLTLSGAAGAIPQVPNLTLTTGTTLTIDNSAAYNGDRLGDTSSLSFTGTGAVASYLPPASGASNPAERIGVLNAAAAGGVFSVAGSGTQPIVLSFQSLNAANSVTLRGFNLGLETGNFTRILIESFTTNQNVIPNVFYAATAGTGTSNTPAGYDTTRGIIPFTPPAQSGTVIDNVNNPPGTSTVAAFTTSGDTTAVTGAQIFSLTLSGGSTLTLAGGNAAQTLNNNTPDGTLVLSGGQLTVVTSAKTINSAAARTLSFGTASGLIDLSANLTIAQNVTLLGTGGLSLTGGTPSTLLVNGPVNVGGTVSVGGGQTLTLAATSSLGTSRLAVSSGTINFNPVGATVAGVDASGTGVVNLNGAGTVTGVTFNGGTVNVNANTTLGASGATGTGGQFTLATGATLTTNTPGTINTTLAGPGALAFAPATAGGLLTLGGTNTYAGGTTVTDGNVTLTNPSGFGTGPVAWSTTVTRILTVPAGTVPNNLALTNAGAGNFDISHAAGTANLLTDLTGAISGTAAGAGVLRIGFNTTPGNNNVVRLSNPNNSFTGNVRVYEGFLAVTSNGSLGNAANTLDLNTTNPGGLRFDGPNVDLNRSVSATFSTNILNTNGNNATMSGVISGGSNLDKTGAGILTVSNAANTFTGNFSVSGGTLRVNGTLPGTAAGNTLTVAAGAGLGGTGTVGTDAATTRNTTLAGGSTLAPGASIGTLTTFGNVTVTGAANPSPTVWQIELNGIAPNTAATASTTAVDRLVVNGNLTFATSATNRIRIDLTQLGGTFSGGPVFYNVAGFTGTLTGFDPTNFDITGSFTPGSASISLGNNGQFLVVQFTPVPEPATLLAVAAGGLAVGRLVRRRRAVAV